MNLRSILGNLFGRSAGSPSSTLRNKPGGLAWIRGLDEAGSLNGQIVTTVRIATGVLWEIDPPLPLQLTYRLMDVRGRIAEPGDTTFVISIHDSCLVPLKNPGEGARSEERCFQPPVTHTKETA